VSDLLCARRIVIHGELTQAVPALPLAAVLEGCEPAPVGSYYAVMLSHAARVMQRAWRHAVSDPLHGFCRARLLREWRQLLSEQELPDTEPPIMGALERPRYGALN
jgi:hypothetical protein